MNSNPPASCIDEIGYFKPRRKLMDESSLVQWFKQINTRTRLGTVDLCDFGPFTHGTLDELELNLLFTCVVCQKVHYRPAKKLGT